MTVYGVNQFCYRLTADEAHRALACRDPRAAAAAFDLTPREADAIVDGDVGYLFEAGVHPLLLVRLFAFAVGGLTESVYSERMREWAAARRVE